VAEKPLVSRKGFCSMECASVLRASDRTVIIPVWIRHRPICQIHFYGCMFFSYSICSFTVVTKFCGRIIKTIYFWRIV